MGEEPWHNYWECYKWNQATATNLMCHTMFHLLDLEVIFVNIHEWTSAWMVGPDESGAYGASSLKAYTVPDKSFRSPLITYTELYTA